MKMRIIMKRPSCILSFAMILFSAITNAQSYSDSRFVSKSFSASGLKLVELNNKYGDVVVENWDKDSLKFEIEITVKGEKYEHLKMLMDMVKTEVFSNGDFASASTKIGEESGMLQKSRYAIANKISGNQRIIVDYKLYMPTRIPLRLKNRFGDVILPDMPAHVDLEVAHGNVRGRSFKSLNAELSYGELRATKILKATLNLNYMDDVEIDEVLDLELISVSSKLHIEKVETLELDSKHDKLIFDELNSVRGETSFTRLKIARLNKRCILNSKFGEVKIEALSNTLNSVNCIGASTDFEIFWSEGFTANFDLQLENARSVVLPISGITIIKDQTMEKLRVLNGKIGTATQGADLRINAKNAYITLGHQ